MTPKGIDRRDGRWKIVPMSMTIKYVGKLTVWLAFPLMGLASPTIAAGPSVEDANEQSPYIVFFDWDESIIKPDGAETIDKAAAAFGKLGRGAVRLIGHSDRSGGTAANARLSQRRVEAVRTLLAEKGVQDSEIVSQAVGESSPLVAVADGVREAQNRSVEIRLEPATGQQ